MGAAAVTLTGSEKAELTAALRERLEGYTARELGEAEVQQRLTEDFAVLAHKHRKVVSVEAMDGGLGASDETKHGSADAGDGSVPHYMRPIEKRVRPEREKPTQDKRSGRRRSFDDKSADRASRPRQSASTPALETMAAAVAAATPGLDGLRAASTDENADSWDSVTHQPFCTICQMAFKTPGLLERHNDFSEVHRRNLRKLEAGGRDDLDHASLAEKIPTKQIEGVHYKLLYTGSKLFWRTQHSVDVSLYLHILPHAVEAICFDVTKHKELNRLYFDYNTIVTILEKSGRLEELISLKRSELAKNRFSHPNDANLFKDEIEKSTVVSFIMQRIQPVMKRLGPEEAVGTTEEGMAVSVRTMDAPSDRDAPECEGEGEESGPGFGSGRGPQTTGMVFSLLNTEESMKSPLLQKPPVVLIPVPLGDRRKARSSGEVDETLDSIQENSAAAASETEKAQNYSQEVDRAFEEAARKVEAISLHMFRAVTYMDSRKRSVADFNVPRRRWHWAARRVMRMCRVAETKARLAELAVKQSASATASVKQ